MEAATASPCLVRLLTPEERSYVIATWLRSFWATARGKEFRGRMEADYLRTYDARIKAALDAGTRVDVAYDPEFPAVIVGWMAHTTGTLHYVYVRRECRLQGVARLLLSQAPQLWAHSHLTPDYVRLMKAGVVRTTHRPGHFHEQQAPGAEGARP